MPSSTTRPLIVRRRIVPLCILLALTAMVFVPLPFSSSQERQDETIKVGIMHSLTGFMALSETSLKDVELMAIEEINAAGGVQVGDKKMKIEAIVEDPASDFQTRF